MLSSSNHFPSGREISAPTSPPNVRTYQPPQNRTSYVSQSRDKNVYIFSLRTNRLSALTRIKGWWQYFSSWSLSQRRVHRKASSKGESVLMTLLSLALFTSSSLNRIWSLSGLRNGFGPLPPFPSTLVLWLLSASPPVYNTSVCVKGGQGDYLLSLVSILPPFSHLFYPPATFSSLSFSVLRGPLGRDVCRKEGKVASSSFSSFSSSSFFAALLRSFFPVSL